MAGKREIAVTVWHSDALDPPWPDPMHTLFSKPAAEWTTEENMAWLNKTMQDTLAELIFG